MIIDINTSLGKRVDPDPRYSADALIAQLRSHGITRALAYSQRAVEYDPRGGNREILETAGKRPELLAAAVVDARDIMGLDAELEFYDQAGAVAIRFVPEKQGWSISSRRFRRILEKVPALKNIRFICLSTAGQAWNLMEEAARMARDLELPLLLADVRYDNMAEAICVLQEYPGVCADTNWLSSIDAVKVMVKEVGAHKLLYGSAFPANSIQKSLNQVLEADLPDGDKTAILAGNAVKLLGLKESLDRPAPDHLLMPRRFDEEAIDVHSHLGYWRYPIPNDDYDPRGMLARMARYGIKYSVVSTYEAMRYDVSGGNRKLAAAIAPHRNLFGYVELHPHNLDLSCAELDTYYQSPQFVGCELELTHIPGSLAQDSVRQLLGEVARRGRPVLLKPGEGDTGLEEKKIAAEFPDLIVIHAHGFDSAWAEMVKDAPNILVEFNSSRACHYDVRDALDILGPERVLFGTDQTLLSVGAAVGLYLDAEMTPLERKKVMSENARRIFRLPVPAQ